MTRQNKIFMAVRGVLYLALYLITRYFLVGSNSDGDMSVKMTFAGLGMIPLLYSYVRWMGAYTAHYPNPSYYASIIPHPSEKYSELTVLCLNHYKWIAIVILIITL